MAVYTLQGREYNLVYNLHTMEIIQDEAQDVNEVMNKFRENRMSVKVLRVLFAAMANTGEWLKGLPENVTGHEIDRLGLKGIDTLSTMMLQTMQESLRSETTGGNEADDEKYDLVLMELEKEKNGMAGGGSGSGSYTDMP